MSTPRDENDQRLERGDHYFVPVLDFELAVVGCSCRRLDEDVPELRENRETAKEARDNAQRSIPGYRCPAVMGCHMHANTHNP